MNSPITEPLVRKVNSPAHAHNQQRQAIRLFQAIVTGHFGDRAPTADEVLQIASQLVLSPLLWTHLTEIHGGPVESHTRGAVLGLFFQLAEQSPSATQTHAKTPVGYRVKYFDAKARGGGIQIRTFPADAETEACEFAATHQLYCKPCRVEAVWS